MIEELKAIIPLHVKMTGEAESNIQIYEKSVLDSIEALRNKELITDQDFADAAVLVKICKEQEELLEKAKKDAISETPSIHNTIDAIDSVQLLLREIRLAKSKEINAEKDRRKDEIINKHLEAISNIASELKDAFGLQYFRANITDYRAGQSAKDAVKGKKSLESMQSSLDELEQTFRSQYKSRCEEIKKNVEYITARPDQTIFQDLNSIAMYDYDRLVETVGSREQAAELQRQNEALRAAKKEEPEIEPKEQPLEVEKQKQPDQTNEPKGDFEIVIKLHCTIDEAKSSAVFCKDRFGESVKLNKIG